MLPSILADTKFIINAIFSILGLVLACLAIWVTLQRRKEVSYKIISDAPIISPQRPVAHLIEVQFDGRPANDLHFVILRVWNSGNTPIEPGDFHSPIEFSFGAQAEILGTEILERVPRILGVSLTQSQNNVRLERLLLNRNNSIRLRVWLTGFGDVKDIKGEAQITNGKMLKRGLYNPAVAREVLRLSLAVVFLVIILLSFAIPSSLLLLQILLPLLALLGFVLLLATGRPRTGSL